MEVADCLPLLCDLLYLQPASNQCLKADHGLMLLLSQQVTYRHEINTVTVPWRTAANLGTACLVLTDMMSTPGNHHKHQHLPLHCSQNAKTTQAKLLSPCIVTTGSNLMYSCSADGQHNHESDLCPVSAQSWPQGGQLIYIIHGVQLQLQSATELMKIMKLGVASSPPRFSITMHVAANGRKQTEK